HTRTPYTSNLSLHDALTILVGAVADDRVDGGRQRGRAGDRPGRGADGAARRRRGRTARRPGRVGHGRLRGPAPPRLRRLLPDGRSEEHTSELQSRENLVCCI